MQKDGKFQDFRQFLPNYKITVVVDIGANVGDTVEDIIAEFPKATIHAFEPVGATFAKLSNRFASNVRVICHNCAIGSAEGTALITARGTATGNRIVTEAGELPVERIRVRTGDEVLSELGLERISFAKIDTEGFDLEALRGFREALEMQRIDAFQVEVGMGSQNRKHVPFHEIESFALQHGYWLFKLYNQSQETKGKPVARRADAVFISDSLASQNLQTKRKPLLKRMIPGFLR